MEEALNTQKCFFRSASSMINSIPVVGHVKGGIHASFGDVDGALIAIQESTHSLAVCAGGTVGFVLGGPAGAVAGGVIFGSCADLAITAANPNDEYYGTIERVRQIVENPTDAGNYVDAVAGVIHDGLGGFSAGQTFGKKIECKLKDQAL